LASLSEEDLHKQLAVINQAVHQRFGPEANEARSVTNHQPSTAKRARKHSTSARLQR
jgi:hypothetical protein